jgi:twitching motility protein PilT
MNLQTLLDLTVAQQASDLHLITGLPPVLRVHGQLVHVLHEAPVVSEELLLELKKYMSAEHFERLSVNKEIDYSINFSDKARFRVNAYTQRGGLAAAFRLIPTTVPSMDSLGLPPMVHKFTTLKQGFVLVTGPTGQGKSTTLAAILNEINKQRACHIVTIEDPIEFILKPDRSIVSQREMGTDTHSWSIALRSVLREDPDVVLIGEMRDYETIAAALTIAETGHLVFATLHTNSAAQTVDRIVDVFPHEQQDQVRLQLSQVLEAVFSQRLIPSQNNQRAMAYELMTASNAIKTAIREGKSHQIDSMIQTSSEAGMNTLENSLAALVTDGKVSFETAQEYCLRPELLARLLRS